MASITGWIPCTAYPVSICGDYHQCVSINFTLFLSAEPQNTGIAFNATVTRRSASLSITSEIDDSNGAGSNDDRAHDGDHNTL